MFNGRIIEIGTVRSTTDGTVRSTTDGTVRSTAIGTVQSTAIGTVRSTAIGTVRSTTDGLSPGRLTIDAPKVGGRLRKGGSVCVHGVCLSATEVGDTWFRADVGAETARRSTLSELAPGALVNLEAPLLIGDPVDCHLVQGHVDAVGKVVRVDDDGAGGGQRVWVRPPRRFLDEVVGKASVAVDGVSLTVAEVLPDRFSVALIPITRRETTLGSVQEGDRVNLESDLLVKTARELHASARLVATRSLAALPWVGELRGAAGVEKCAAQLAAGGAVLIYDPDREAEADVVYAGARFRPEAMAFLLTVACGHTTVPCDRDRLDRLEIPPMPGAGDRHGTAPHVPVDLAAASGTGVSAYDRAATIRRLSDPEARPEDFLRPGHVFPLAGRRGGCGSGEAIPKRHWPSVRRPACRLLRSSARSWAPTGGCSTVRPSSASHFAGRCPLSASRSWPPACDSVQKPSPDGDFEVSPLTGDQLPGPLRGAAPDAVLDVVVEGVVQAAFLYRAPGADSPGDRHSDAVIGEKDPWLVVPASAIDHPAGIHLSTFLDHPPRNRARDQAADERGPGRAYAPGVDTCPFFGLP